MILHKLPPFQNVLATGTAVMPFVHQGQTVVGIIFKRGGTAFTTAMLANIRLRLDGKQFIDITGSDLEDINSYEEYGISAATYNYLPFADLKALTQRGQMMGAVDTSIAGMKPMELEVDIAGATAPTLEAWVILAAPKAADDPNKETIRALLKATHAISAAGEFEQPLPLGSRLGALIHRVYSFNTNVTKIQVAKDGLWLLQEGEVGLLNFQQALGNRTTVAGLDVFDPTFNDAMTDSIATLRPDGTPATFSFKFTVSAADTIVTYSSLFTTISNV